MATILGRLLTLGVVLAFVGATVQLVPCGMAYLQSSVRSDMAAGSTQPKAPCTDRAPVCTDHFGCVAALVVPTAPPSVAVALQWISLDYDLAVRPLRGISLKPDLSPPIPAA
ncbi:MAG TPA: hypothetical protein VGS13_01410 [Stellaceae bacterium]|nr:hypothetical protein [Stellaceae bacterium]